MDDVEYKAGKEIKYEDDLSLAQKNIPKREPNIVGVDKADAPLFSTLFTKKVKAPNADMCISFRIPANDNGKFELVIKVSLQQKIKLAFTNFSQIE